MNLKALIVDDEYPAREELRYLLNKIGGVDIIGEAASGNEAMSLINALNYDVIFLDINFPLSNGIEIGKKIQELVKPPYIIYITAYQQYACNAFEVNAIAYILKPIEEAKLVQAIDKIKKLKKVENPAAVKEKETVKEELLTRIPVEIQGKIILLPVEEIFYAFSEGSYVFVKTAGKKYITKYTLNSLEEKLDPKLFFRAHRSYLINLHKIKEISPLFKGSFFIVLSDDKNSEIPVSRRQGIILKKILDI